jgi:hypothetical protein
VTHAGDGEGPAARDLTSRFDPTRSPFKGRVDRIDGIWQRPDGRTIDKDQRSSAFVPSFDAPGATARVAVSRATCHARGSPTRQAEVSMASLGDNVAIAVDCDVKWRGISAPTIGCDPCCQQESSFVGFEKGGSAELFSFAGPQLN